VIVADGLAAHDRLRSPRARRASVIARRGTWQMRTVVGWARMRGSLAAAALALPGDFRSATR
jgi:hypothetical protein